MATKKQNRRSNVRRLRRILNRTVGDVKGTRNGILKARYGAGVGVQHLRLRPARDDAETD